MSMSPLNGGIDPIYTDIADFMTPGSNNSEFDSNLLLQALAGSSKGLIVCGDIESVDTSLFNDASDMLSEAVFKEKNFKDITDDVILSEEIYDIDFSTFKISNDSQLLSAFAKTLNIKESTVSGCQDEDTLPLGNFDEIVLVSDSGTEKTIEISRPAAERLMSREVVNALDGQVSRQGYRIVINNQEAHQTLIFRLIIYRAYKINRQFEVAHNQKATREKSREKEKSKNLDERGVIHPKLIPGISNDKEKATKRKQSKVGKIALSSFRTNQLEVSNAIKAINRNNREKHDKKREEIRKEKEHVSHFKREERNKKWRSEDIDKDFFSQSNTEKQ